MKRIWNRIALASLVLALAPAVAAAQEVVIDSLVAVSPDARVEIHNANGSVRVGTWERPAVRIVARASSRVPIRIEPGGTTLVIHSAHPQRRATVAYEVTVPRGADVAVHGQNTPVTVTGAEGRVEVHTMNGGVTVRGGRGRVELHSVNGPIEVTGVRGAVEVHTVNQGAVVRDVVGDVSVASVNGAVILEAIDSRNVQATSVQGGVRYAGSVHPDGLYRLSSHNGSVVMALPGDASAHVTVSTFNGTLRVDFPVTLNEGSGGKRFDFTLGSGDARIELTSFNGRIELRRP